MSTSSSREAAREQIHRRQVFIAAVTTFIVISPTILVVYWLSGPDSFFWPAYPIVGLLIACGAIRPPGASAGQPRRTTSLMKGITYKLDV